MAAADDLGLSGRVVDGRFRIERSVGRGDMSVVFKGTDIRDGRSVAVKFLAPPPGMDPALLAMFFLKFTEASQMHRTLADECPHLAKIYDVGSTFAAGISAEVPYFVREWFEGHSLGNDLLLRRAREETGRPLRSTLEMLAPAAEALAFAHSKGATHERVTPQSFFLAQGRILKVLDFGVARALYPTARDKEGGGLFAVSAALLPYMAPEQLDSTHGPIGPATDVYALALLVLELLCDRPAMEASPGTDLATRITDPNERPTQGLLWTSIPTETEAVLARAVALKPEDRQRDAREFWDELTASVPGSELAARAPGPVTLPDAMGPLPPPRPPPPPPLNPRDEPVVTSKVGAGERAAEAEARAAKEARDRDSGRQTIRQISPPVHDADFEPDSMEGEPVRKAVGPLLPPSVTPFSHDPSIIVRSMPPPPPPPQAAPPPAPVPPVASRRAPTMIVRRPPAETVKLERVPEDAPSAAWKYIVVVMLTAGVVVGGAYGVRAFLAWRADRAAASADVDAAPVVAAPVDAASSAPSVDAIDANVAAMDAGPHPFDLDVARQALDLVAPSLADCKVPKGKPPLKVKVIFAPDGTVTAAYPLPQWQGLTPAICMARRLKEAHVPPFKGLPGTVTYLAARP